MRDRRFSALRWGIFVLTALAISTTLPTRAPARTSPRPLPTYGEASRWRYRELGKLPRPEACEDTTPYASVFYVSPNGETVAGTMSVDIGNHHWLDHAFVWTQRDGLRDIGELLDKTHTSHVDAVASDGSMVAGSTADSQSQWSFVWQRGVGINESIPRAQKEIAHPLFQKLEAVSADGRFTVGRDASVLFRWSQDGGTEILGDIPGGDAIRAATNDAGFLVGARNCEAFVWSKGEGLRPLGFLRRTPGSIAYGISEDGQIVVGTSGNRLFRWTRRGGMEDLGLIPSREQDAPLPRDRQQHTITIENGAYTLSRDGSAILGHAGRSFFLWTPQTGSVPLQDILVTSGATEPSRSRWIENATLSPDGRTIWGVSRAPLGDLYRWRLDVRDKD